jgi:hypothetical protein
MPDKLDSLGDREEFFEHVAKEIEAFLLRLEESPDDLIRFINNRVAFLNETDLSDQAKALLLESDYSVILEVMKYRESQAVRWICIWVI